MQTTQNKRCEFCVSVLFVLFVLFVVQSPFFIREDS